MKQSLTKAEAIVAAMKIDGWLSEREAETLYDLAKRATGPIIEIGSWRGRSTAAIALGSMAGAGHPVFAVDSFIGVAPNSALTHLGGKPERPVTPELLRSNLDSAGVNGLVKIVAAPSEIVAEHLPECSLLFVDGAHHYDAVVQDLDLYLPKVQSGGSVVLHDCWELEPGVVRAADERISAKPESWRVCRRVDSAMVFEKRSTERRSVFLAAPGGNYLWGASRGLMTASLGAHTVYINNSQTGWDDMPNLWAQGLNAARRGTATHFAMLHSDVVPSPGWLDVLLSELEDRNADLVSTVIPIKDKRGLTTCGIGDHANHWGAFRRFTMSEIMGFPETFGVADTPHPDKFLLHNTGCWVADLRKTLWRETDAHGCLRCYFDFPVRGRVNGDGDIVHERESEDWYFSRKMAELNAVTFATRKVGLTHLGNMEFSNEHAWGLYKADEETRGNWDIQAVDAANQN